MRTIKTYSKRAPFYNAFVGTNPFSLSIRLPVPAPPLIFGGPSILLVFGNLHCKN